MRHILRSIFNAALLVGTVVTLLLGAKEIGQLFELSYAYYKDPLAPTLGQTCAE